MPETVKDFEFKSFSPDWQEKGIEFLNGLWCLYLHGGMGTGKSCFASAVLMEKKKAYPGMICTWVDSATLSEWMHKLTEWPSLFESYTRRPFLIIDDMGIDRPTDYVSAEFKRFIMKRYRNAVQTVITSNLDAEVGMTDFLDDDGRFYSRLHEGNTIATGDEDLRKKQ